MRIFTPGLLPLFVLWRERIAGRRALAAMEPRLLRDIGLTPCEAAFESSKPCWRP